MPLMSGSFKIDQAHAAPLFDRARKNSYVIQNATRVATTASGTIVPVFSGLNGGGWVGEGQRKKIDEQAVSNKEMNIRKWAKIVPVTMEALDDNNEMARAELLLTIAENAQADFARSVDLLAATGGGFSGQSFLDQTTKSIKLGTATQAAGGVYKDFNQGLRLLVSDTSAGGPRVFTGALLDNETEPDINDAVDLQGRPLFVDSPVGAETNAVNRFGRLLGRPTGFISQLSHGSGVTRTVGYMGNWERVFYGLVGDISITYDSNATYFDAEGNGHSAFQDNLVLTRVEARIGVLVADPEDFVKVYGVGAGAGS